MSERLAGWLAVGRADWFGLWLGLGLGLGLGAWAWLGLGTLTQRQSVSQSVSQSANGGWKEGRKQQLWLACWPCGPRLLSQVTHGSVKECLHMMVTHSRSRLFNQLITTQDPISRGAQVVRQSQPWCTHTHREEGAQEWTTTHTPRQTPGTTHLHSLTVTSFTATATATATHCQPASPRVNCPTTNQSGGFPVTHSLDTSLSQLATAVSRQ